MDREDYLTVGELCQKKKKYRSCIVPRNVYQQRVFLQKQVVFHLFRKFFLITEVGTGIPSVSVIPLLKDLIKYILFPRSNHHLYNL